MRGLKKVVLAPDSFKGTMTSLEVCRIMAASVRRLFPQAEVASVPVADGGEGTVAAFLAASGGEERRVSVTGPFFGGAAVDAAWGLLAGGKTAVIEMAACAGLPLVEGRADPEAATTFGAGQLVKAALDAGARRVILGLGGSATCDGGCGAAVALGVRFLDAAGRPFVPTGGTLRRVAHIDLAQRDPRLAGGGAPDDVEKRAMCDVDNPLTGPSGAACVFGPQKGASPEAVTRLDEGLGHLARVARRDLGFDLAGEAGAGAAGGMGFGLRAFLGFGLKPGIETVLDTAAFDQRLAGADLAFSGEGRLDTQSLRGKVICGVARRTKAAGVPLVAVVGDIGDDIEAVYGRGVAAVFSINRVAVPYAEARLRAKADLALTMDNILRLLAADR